MPLGFDPVGGSALTDTQPQASAATVSAVVTGVSATASIGSTTIKLSPKVRPSGLSAAGSIGAVTVSAKANVPVTGVSATTVFSPAISVSGDGVSVNVQGMSATALLGQAAAVVSSTPNTVTLTGLSATGQLGDVTVPAVVSKFIVDVEGVTALALVGSTDFVASGSVLLTGLQASTPDSFGIKAIVSSFGNEVSQAKASRWTVVKPA